MSIIKTGWVGALVLSSFAAWAQGAGPTDPQIAAIVVTANQVDIDAGKLAVAQSTNADVKDFGQQMVTGHTGVNRSATELVTKLKVTPEDNDVSKSLKSDAEASASNLQGKSGADFDKGYIDREVAYHQAVLDALDKTLIPGAQNAELKALLEKARPSFAAHLARAKDIQTALNK